MARKAKDKLSPYREKRDFQQTAEPSGGGESSGQPIFVIQKHDARALHYDFRIECDGVMKSWAIPKGPSTDTKVKRLAMPTEDHPLDYADFEGTIPEGEYGAGTVLVWDRGTYRNMSEQDGNAISVKEACEKGHVAFWLEGQKLRGGYKLIRTSMGGREQWLFIKKHDEHADAARDPVRDEPQSALSGRTIEEIAKSL